MDAGQLTPLRISAVSYVNALPLLDGLETDPRVHLVLESPAAAADALVAGTVDAALVPAVTLLRDDRLAPVGTGCIACDGAVDSVLLQVRVAPHCVTRVALDPESRSSQRLARWLLKRVYGVNPEWRERRAAEAVIPDDCDAGLVIGDRALHVLASGAPVLDLGSEWKRATGQPFVFAVWAARREHPRSAELLDCIESARRRGLAGSAAHARVAAQRTGLSPELCAVYLGQRIRYRFDDAAAAGLGLFLDLVSRGEC
jgi:chorismate dehydratase